MTGPDRILVLDQLRGLAALSVAWFHMTNGYDGWVQHTGSLGWLGVEAFFVLSGFVIPYSLSRLKPAYSLQAFPVFVLRRIVRLEPPYIASVALVVVLAYASALAPGFQGAPFSFDPLQVAAHLFYVIPLTELEWLQPVYWTLAYEFAFYLFIGIAFPFVGRTHQVWRARLAALAVLALAAFGVVSPLICLFVMGFAVYRRLSQQEGLAWTCFLLLACTLPMIFRNAWEGSIVGCATALIILFHERLPAPEGRLGAALTGLGAISYSLYLLHVPIGGRIVNLGGRFVSGDLSELVLSLAALALSVLAAVVFWKLVENPAAAAARKMRGIRSTPVVTREA